MVGTHTSFGTSHYGFVFGLVNVSYNTEYYYSIGLDYSRQLSKRWDFCSGLEYTYNDMTKKYIKDEGESVRFTLVTVPVQFKYNLGKHVYFNGGAIFSILAKEHYFDREENSWGLLGVGLGIGLKH